MPINAHNIYTLAPDFLQNNTSLFAFTDASGMVLDAATEMIAYKYYPATTSPIEAVDIRATLVGTSPMFKVGVYADASDIPDTATPTQLGTDTPEFSWPATGFSGIQTLASNTGNLTVNTPVWIVLKYSSGTIDGTNYIHANARGTSWPYQRIRHHNGTNWTTTSSQVVVPNLVIKHADGTYAGFPMTAIAARSTQNDIYVNGGTSQVQGIRFKMGAQFKLNGVMFYIDRIGTPNSLICTVYEGDTSKDSATISQAFVIDVGWNVIWFDSPPTLAASTNIYAILSQTGTSDSADYDLYTFVFNSTYIDAILQPDTRFVYGNGSTPSTFNVSTTEFPLMFPIIADPAADFVAGGSGGGLRLVGHGGLAS